MSNVKIATYGQILEGALKDWYVFVQDDAENTGGYLILLSISLDLANPQGFDIWAENFQDVCEIFKEKNLKVHWLK